MLIKEFIEAAIEEGWNNEMRNANDWVESHDYFRVLLNPEAWKAVGKVKGWNTFESLEPLALTPEWFNHMHRMIDALGDGKTLEEYISTL